MGNVTTPNVTKIIIGPVYELAPFFNNFNVNLQKILKEIYFWCNNSLNSDILGAPGELI